MSPSKLGVVGAALAVGLAAAWWGFGRLTLAQETAVGVQQQNQAVEVLTRGPVHEAFAEPVTFERTEPLMIDTAPPEPIEELPPEQVPEGDYVNWISGYWAWDDERHDFIWVSGVWRDVPPGQRWVPGYWSDSGRGWYWTAGFWISEEVAEVEYLPEPPQSLEAGPQIEAPSADHVWVPGVWRHRETRYVWQPGYWTVVRPGWIWVPARYVWCSSGYVFVDGYWDYPLVRRGVLFAPVYYYEPVYVQPYYYYTPTVVIHSELLITHLFARPAYRHYYFGDFYAPRYREFGIYPWFSLHVGRVTYDPLFSYYSWYHGRRDPGWHRHVRRRYDFFATHEHYRPAHTFRELRRQRFADARIGDVNIQNVVVQQNNFALTLNQYVQNVEREADVPGRRDRMRFTRLPEERRSEFAERAAFVRTFAERRGEIETAAVDPATPGRPERDVRRTLPIEQLAEQVDRHDRARRGREDRFDGRRPALTEDGVAEQVDPTRRRARERDDPRDVAEATPDERLPIDREARDAITRDERRARLRDRADLRERAAEPDLERPAEDLAHETPDAVTREEQRARFRERAGVRDRVAEPGVGRAREDFAPRARDPIGLERRPGADAIDRLREREAPDATTPDEQRARFRERQELRGSLEEPGARRTREDFAPRAREPLQPERRPGLDELPGPAERARGQFGRPELPQTIDPRARELDMRQRQLLERERERQFRDRWDAGRRREGLDVPTQSDIREDVRRSLGVPQRVEDPARGRPLSPLEQPDSPVRAGRGQDRRGAAMSDAIQAAPRFRTPVDVGEPRLQPDPSARQFERSRGQFERPARPDLGVPGRTPTIPDRRQDLRGRFESLRPPPQDATPGGEALRERLGGRREAESPQRQQWRGAEAAQQRLRSAVPTDDELRSRARPGFSPERRTEPPGQMRGGFRGFERPDGGDAGREALQRMGRGAGRGAIAPQETQPRTVERGPRLERGGGDEGRGRGRPERGRDRDEDD